MRIERAMLAVCSCLGVMLLTTESAFAALDTKLDEVSLRKSCPAGSTSCTTSATDVVNWVKAKTSATKFSTVRIGPGTFSLPTTVDFCLNARNVSFIGSGRDITVLRGGRSGGAAMTLNGCVNLAFQDMTVRSDSWAEGRVTGSQSGIDWKNTIAGAVSVWSNVNVQAGRTAWHDNGGLHYWFGSKLDIVNTLAAAGTATSTYHSQGGQTWFYGGELLAVHGLTGGSAGAIFVVNADAGDVRVFGSAIRLRAAMAGTTRAMNVAAGFGGLYARAGIIHVHGGVVSVDATDGTAQAVIGISAANGAMVHTPGAAFVMKTGTGGQFQRILTDATSMVESPFTWPAASTAPMVGGTAHLVSQDGQDMFVETDCQPAGNCQSGGSSPHLMVYAQACMGANPPATAGPWFDTVTKACRQ